jgi:flavorubredoxin
MERPYAIEAGCHVMPGSLQVPTLGFVPVNAYYVEGAQPYLVDTGLHADAAAFMEALEQIADVSALRWIYMTHCDPDHMGALRPLLRLAPRARVVTTFVGLAKLQLQLVPLELARVHLLNPGQELDLGDRVLRVMRPHTYDAPETTSFYDPKLDALFSSDSFGAALPEITSLANAIPAKTLADGQVVWATLDSPWIHTTDRAAYADHLHEISDLDPNWILSSHLPPARRMTRDLCRNLAGAPDARPYTGPDQDAFEALLQAAPAPTPAPPAA